MTHPSAREPRYCLLDQQQNVRVSVEFSGVDHCEPIDAALEDLSSGGAKLILERNIPLHEAVQLQIDDPTSGLNIEVNAEVCWLRPTDDGCWRLGCAFSPRLPEDIFGTLAQRGHIERRHGERHATVMRTTARWELEDKDMPVCIADFSVGGFCLLCPLPGRTGQRLRLQFPATGSDAVTWIAAKAQWQADIDDGFLVGFIFNDSEDYERLKRSLYVPG